MEKKPFVPEDLSGSNELQASPGTNPYFYRVVYSNGLNEPVETLVGSSDPLALDDDNVAEAVCQFVQSSIDMDCRQLLFIYQEYPQDD